MAGIYVCDPGPCYPIAVGIADTFEPMSEVRIAEIKQVLLAASKPGPMTRVSYTQSLAFPPMILGLRSTPVR